MISPQVEHIEVARLGLIDSSLMGDVYSISGRLALGGSTNQSGKAHARPIINDSKMKLASLETLRVYMHSKDLKVQPSTSFLRKRHICHMIFK